MRRDSGLDDITRAVMAREEVVAYLNGSHGESGARAEARVHEYLDELRTTQRHAIYRVLKHPLYPIFRKITRIAENIDSLQDVTARGRVVYISNHRSHIDYLIEPLVLEDHEIRPPVIAAGINLFGGPLGLIHRHVTGAIPIRRNVKDPGYLITLKAYVAEILQRHDLMFYIEGGRSYSGELKTPKTGLAERGAAFGTCRSAPDAVRDRLRPRARGSHPGAAEGEAHAKALHARVRRDGARRGRLQVARVRDVRHSRSRPEASIPRPAATCSSSPITCATRLGAS